MNLTDTIVAPASAPGWSPRAFIRVSGPGAFAALPTSSTLRAPPTRGLHRLHWPLTPSVRAERRNVTAAVPGANFLPVLALLFPGPASYTGEDSFELQLPGNPNLVERIVRDLAFRPGFRLAEPGEFTARAYLHNRLTLDQAEGVAATIAAQNDDQLRAASQLLGGRTGAEYRTWADELTTLLALTEAGIDFTDQDDVVAIQPTILRERLTAIADSITRHTGPARAAAADHAAPTIALFGLPNAGKSTLFNALLGRPRAVVSDIAGTTRDVLAESLELSKDIPGGPTVLLCDLPGQELGPSCEIDRAAQAIAAHALATADVLLWCDPTGRFESGAPQAGTHAAPPAGPRVIRVRTKADLPVSDQSPAAIAVCALDGYNLRVLRRAIADQASSSRAAGVAALLPRHRRSLESTLEQLRGAVDLIAPGTPAPAELVALRLRTALDHLGELIGHVSPDDVIGRVFATFCVGK